PLAMTDTVITRRMQHTDAHRRAPLVVDHLLVAQAVQAVDEGAERFLSPCLRAEGRGARRHGDRLLPATHLAVMGDTHGHVTLGPSAGRLRGACDHGDDGVHGYTLLRVEVHHHESTPCRGRARGCSLFG